MAALRVSWKSVPALSKTSGPVVTGEESDEEGESEAQLRFTDRPILVYVCEEAGCEDSEAFESVVLKNDKVALGSKAFHLFRMTPEQVSEDELLKDEGKTVPRLVFIEPVKMKTSVVESKDLKASKVYKAMKSMSGKFWKQKLDSIVKKHLKMLQEQDNLSNTIKTLQGKLERAKDDASKAKKVEKELEEVNETLSELAKAQGELWKLTPKHKPEADSAS